MIKNKYLQLEELLLLFLSEQPKPTLNPHVCRVHTVPRQWTLTSEQVILTFFSHQSFLQLLQHPNFIFKTHDGIVYSVIWKFPQICSNKSNHAYILDIVATI